MKKKRILVTGADSQLGKCLKNNLSPDFDFDFQSKQTLDITDKPALKTFFNRHSYDYCLNFAAYTDVNAAEKFPEKCFEVNVKGVENLTKSAQKHDFTLIHISTDYVFDGKKQKKYRETDATHPLNIYGWSKLQGEEIIRQNLEKYLIVRTSWLYSPFNKNFVKTILRLAKENDEIQLINDQTGTPTRAFDLVKFIIFALEKMEHDTGNSYYGTYHFSNKGKATWYAFGKEILNITGLTTALTPIATAKYKSPAKRPAFSVLSKKKIKRTFGYKIPRWKKSLRDFMHSNNINSIT